MFAELEKVMASGKSIGNYFEALDQNVTGKKSNSGAGKTANYLKQLYAFDSSDSAFRALEYFWLVSDDSHKPMIALLYAISRDSLLAESVNVLRVVAPGEKVSIELLENDIERNHPNQYSPNTRKSMAQNLASSWKQAGFIYGKVKNIRVQPQIHFKVACFAFLLAYINGNRGEFIWSSITTKALCIPEQRLKELAIDCAKNDMMNYQHAGSVTSIGFTNLLTKIGIDADPN